MDKTNARIKFTSHSDMPELLTQMSSGIANEYKKLRIAGYIYSIIFGLTFSIYPALQGFFYNMKNPNLGSLESIFSYIFIIEIITLPIVLILPNRKKTIGVTLFYMGIGDTLEKLSRGEAFQLIKSVDWYYALKQTLLEIIQVSLPIMAPGSVLFIGRGIVEDSVNYLLVGLTGLCAVIASFTYLLYNRFAIEKEKGIEQNQKVYEKSKSLLTNWKPPNPITIYFDEDSKKK